MSPSRRSVIRRIAGLAAAAGALASGRTAAAGFVAPPSVHPAPPRTQEPARALRLDTLPSDEPVLVMLQQGTGRREPLFVLPGGTALWETVTDGSFWAIARRTALD
jgi:hypothetical protein